MQCPTCQADSLRVIDSRDVEAEPAIRRRRECEKCGFRFTTYERVEAPHLLVIKKDGRREQFSREKLSRGVWRACEKRPISEAAIEAAVSAVEQDLRACGETEINVAAVGESAMVHLKKLDQVAYIRFASVYREFTDLDEFQAEVKKTLKNTLSPKRPNVKTEKLVTK
ncbi:transcriptional repressor NrdR [Patescibacteria group bacterium]|nr:transcriptional repressor NrdR [Patescibacteria group bacterium]